MISINDPIKFRCRVHKNTCFRIVIPLTVAESIRLQPKDIVDIELTFVRRARAVTKEYLVAEKKALAKFIDQLKYRLSQPTKARYDDKLVDELVKEIFGEEENKIGDTK